MVVRLTFLFPKLELGGPFKGVLAILKYMDRKLFAPYFVALSPPMHPKAADELAALQCPLIQLGQKSFFDLRVISPLLHHLDETHCDILHTTLLRPDWYGAILKKIRPRIKLVTTIRGVDDVAIRMVHGRLVETVFNFINHRVLTAMDAVVPHSHGLLDFVHRMRVPESRIRLILNGIDLQPFENINKEKARSCLRARMGWPADCVVIGFAGTFWPYKDHVGFIHAAKKLYEWRQDLRFLAIGDGPLLDKMRAMVEKEGLQGIVAMPGHLTDVASFYGAIDLHLFMSFSEGMPRAVLESMACGLPVVATAVTGVVEVVKHEETGLLIPPHDHVAAAEAVRRLLEDNNLRKKLSDAGSNLVREHYSAYAMTKAYEKLYLDLLDCRPSIRNAIDPST